jgi:hypothetical protein
MLKTERVQVDLDVSSWIEGRGVRHTHYDVRVNDAWIPIEELRDVGRTATDPELSFYDDEADEMRVLPPGCQYRITYHPRLPVGTQVRRRISTPLEKSPQHRGAPETMEAAFGRFMAAGYGWKSPKKVAFVDFRVTVRGLVREESWQRRQQRSDVRATTHQHRAAVCSEAVTPAEMEAFARRLVKVG